MPQPSRLFVSSDDRVVGTRPSNFTVKLPAGVESATDVLIENATLPALFYPFSNANNIVPLYLRDASGNDTPVRIPMDTGRWYTDVPTLVNCLNADIQAFALANGGLAGDVNFMYDPLSRKIWLQRAGLGFRLAGYSDPIASSSAMFKLGFTNSLTPPTPQTARVSDGFPDLAGTRSIFCSCSLASGENLTSQSDASVDILTRIPNTATAWGQSIQFSQVLPSMAKPLARSFNSVSIQLLDDDGRELILADNAVVAFTFLLGYKREGAMQIM